MLSLLKHIMFKMSLEDQTSSLQAGLQIEVIHTINCEVVDNPWQMYHLSFLLPVLKLRVLGRIYLNPWDITRWRSSLIGESHFEYVIAQWGMKPDLNSGNLPNVGETKIALQNDHSLMWLLNFLSAKVSQVFVSIWWFLHKLLIMFITD